MIPNEFTKTIRLIKEFNELLFSKFGADITPEQETTTDFIKNNETSNNWVDDITESFEKEYNALNEANTYFIGCKLDVYAFNYENRLKEYLSKSSELREENFIEQELKSISNFNVSDYAPEQLKEIIRASLNRQLSFLEGKLQGLGFIAEFDSKTSQFLKLTSITKPANNLTPDDETSRKISEKIIYLHELGVLDFLRTKKPFNTTTNSLAEILSIILGEKRSTLQSYLNPIYSTGTSQSNNPLNNPNSLAKVKTHLAEIGFKLDK